MDTWLFIVLPLVAATLGGGAVWVAQRLLFGPLPFGDRFPAALEGSGGLVADRLSEGLGLSLHPGELFRLMEPEKIAAAVARAVNARLDEHVDEIMRQRHSVLWDNLPQAMRVRVYARVGRQLPSIFDNLVEEIAEHMDQLTDLQQLLREVIGSRRDMLPGLLEEALAEECAFLRRTGAGVGLVVGLVQVLAWSHYPHAWLQVLLSGGGALAALLLPRAILYQQGAVSGSGRAAGAGLALVFSRRLAGEVFSARHLLHAVVTGPRAARTRSIIRRHMRPLLETGFVRTTIQLLLGAQGYVHIKQLVEDRMTALTVSTLEDSPLGEQQAVRVEAACRLRLEALAPAEVRALVQPVLDQGLWWRGLVVALLGLLAGLAEVMLLPGMAG